jgi:hypothetical protein
LIEDHEKEENKKLEELVREFTRYYRVTKEQVLDLMLEWEGDLYGFYQFMDDQYRIKPAPIPKF